MRTIMLTCPITGQEEEQEVLRESEDGMYLKCRACGRKYGKEIGELYALFD